MSTLHPERWQQVSPYLDYALSLSNTERAVWMDSFREGNPELAGILENLLSEHDGAEKEKFLQRSMLQITESRDGQTIGPYTLISPLGHGGMGVVWLAERSDGRFQRRVAIKFLQFALATRIVEERFRQEGLILGQLTHPHIAELIDAGVTSRGEPYLVLEYVEERRLTSTATGTNSMSKLGSNCFSMCLARSLTRMPIWWFTATLSLPTCW